MSALVVKKIDEILELVMTQNQKPTITPEDYALELQAMLRELREDVLIGIFGDVHYTQTNISNKK